MSEVADDPAQQLWKALSGQLVFCIHRGLLGQRFIARYTIYFTQMHFLQVVRVVGALIVPNRCPTRYSAQTPVTQQQENDSPNAKIPCVYGTSVNIDESCAP